MINMAIKPSTEERAKLRLGDYWYLVPAEEREKVKHEILEEDAKTVQKQDSDISRFDLI